MDKRKERELIAKETIEILNQGFYIYEKQEKHINDELDKAVNGTLLFKQYDFDELKIPQGKYSTKIDITYETTFGAARRLAVNGEKSIALNFASSKNPGGGFLRGSQAQEEALARASGLYSCIEPIKEYYRINKKCGTCAYTDGMIYSPEVPVFRDDNDELLEEPYTTSIITSPAVNYGAMIGNNEKNTDDVELIMSERIRKILLLAACKNYDTIILGAWGCGVFKNDPAVVAKLFKNHIYSDDFKSVFKKIIFAIPGGNNNWNYKCFYEVFR